MLDKLRARFHRPSPATGIALLALFVALGGTGYAALKLPANSVGTKQLKNNAVTGAKVKNGSLTVGDFGGTLPAGAKGDKGDAGAKGDKGDPGTAGTNGTKGADGTDGAPAGSLKPKVVVTGLASGTANAPVTHVVATFTPAANKAEEVLIRVNWTPPPTGCDAGGPPAGGSVLVRMDGVDVGRSQTAPANGPAQVLPGSIGIVSSATPTSHTVTVDIADNCLALENAVINSATVERVEFG